MFLVNMVLALGWTALAGSLTVLNLATGFVVGYLALAVALRDPREREYLRRFPWAIEFLFFYAWEIFRSSIVVSTAILLPKKRLKPAIVAIPLHEGRDEELLLVASLVTFTPGNLSLDVSNDRSTLYVHTFQLAGTENFRKLIHDKFVRRVERLFNRRTP